ncbi:MAG: DUF3291 domain-containing protein [Pseudomonadota bacterium]
MSQPPRTNLAQFNWATLRYDVDDPRVAEFVDNVARMNLIAERMPGFVWRHHYDSKALSRLKRPLPFERTDRFTTTLSVWRDARALADFAFRTIHNRFYEKRALWFEPHKGPYMVMWYVAEGHRPDIDEAVDRAEEPKQASNFRENSIALNI